MAMGWVLGTWAMGRLLGLMRVKLRNRVEQLAARPIIRSAQAALICVRRQSCSQKT